MMRISIDLRGLSWRLTRQVQYLAENQVSEEGDCAGRRNNAERGRGAQMRRFPAKASGSMAG